MITKTKVWVVDDDPIAVTIIRHLLAQHPKMELTSSFDGAEAFLNALKTNSEGIPELLVLDLNMPLMSGWELLEILMSDFEDKKIPIAVFTSSIDERDELKSKKYPEVVGHFVKPMTSSLLNEIFDQLEKYRGKSKP